MSSVTDIILITAVEDPGIGHVNAYLITKTNHGQLIEVSDYAGGAKYMECDVYAMAANYLEADALIEVFHNTPWEHPDKVQLLLKGSHEQRFELHVVAP